jgi:N-glycosylase/DNA lyase
MTNDRVRLALAELKTRHRNLRQAIRARLGDFARVNPDKYFYELAYCLLTPQSRADHAEAVVDRLREGRFAETGFDPEPLLRDKTHYIRFHRTKARHLLTMRAEFPSILQHLSNGSEARGLREWLVGNVKGLGQKEATHFLRNVGRNEGLAILDRHILRNLKRYGVIRTLPTTLSKKTYLSIERRFQRFAEEIRIPLDELDLLFWSMETGEIRK